jgi:hypothetical protein
MSLAKVGVPAVGSFGSPSNSSGAIHRTVPPVPSVVVVCPAVECMTVASPKSDIRARNWLSMRMFAYSSSSILDARELERRITAFKSPCTTSSECICDKPLTISINCRVVKSFVDLGETVHTYFARGSSRWRERKEQIVPCSIHSLTRHMVKTSEMPMNGTIFGWRRYFQMITSL